MTKWLFGSLASHEGRDSRRVGFLMAYFLNFFFLVLERIIAHYLAVFAFQRCFDYWMLSVPQAVSPSELVSSILNHI